MRPQREWECWTLSTADIEAVAERIGRDPAELSEADIDEIVRLFKSGLVWATEDWEEVLAEAIVLTKGEVR